MTNSLPALRAIQTAMLDDAQRDALRALIIDESELPHPTDALPAYMIDMLRTLLIIASNDPYNRHELSMIKLQLSICPMHRIDYAICFDDDDPECATLRYYFPDHDS